MNARPIVLRRSMLVQAPMADVWRTLADFGGVSLWAGGVRASWLDNEEAMDIGCIRRCQLQRPFLGRDHMQERLTAFEPPHQLAYEVIGAMGPFRHLHNTWRVQAQGSATRVETETHAVPRWAWMDRFVAPLLRRGLERVLDDGLADFRSHVEQAQPHAARLKTNA